MSLEGCKLIANNKKAWHDFFVDEEYECGIELFGTEVKSLRLGHCSIKESFCQIRGEEVYIKGMHIHPYEKGNLFNRDALRDRRLLLHRSEIRKLSEKIREKGYTLVPLKMYFRHGKIKVEIGLATGKKLYDKRQDMAAKAAKRDLARRIKEQRYD